MAKRDYYKVLDRAEDRDRSRDQEGLSAPGDEAIHPDRNPGDRDAEDKLQGGQGSLRGAHRRAQARRSTTSTVTPGSRPRARRRRGVQRRRLQRHLRRCLRRHLRRRAARRPLAGVPRRGPALRARARAPPGGVWPHGGNRGRRSSAECEVCHGTGAAKGSTAPATPAAASARCAFARASFSFAADLPALPRRRPHRPQSLR